MRVAIAFGAAAIMVGLAIQLARVDASVGRPFGPDRLIKALDAVDAVDGLPESAAAQARKALHNRPIDGRAYRVLGQAAAEGDDMRADALLEIAVKRWPRDRKAQGLLVERAFAVGDTEAAAQHLDALLRVAPGIRKPLFAEMVSLLGFPEFRSALIGRMAADPPWRTALIRALSSAETPAAPALAFLDEMAVQTPLADDALQARVGLLRRAGRAQEAREAWLQTIDPEAREAAGLVFDGGFEHPGVTDGYGWGIRPVPGAVIGSDATNPRTGKQALAVSFNGRAVQFAHVQQALALPAGSYRLRAAADNQTGSTRPFVWQLSCDDSMDRIAGLPLPESPGWQTVEASFTVNAACGGQQLTLRHAGRNLTERQMRGTLYLDDIEIHATLN